MRQVLLPASFQIAKSSVLIIDDIRPYLNSTDRGLAQWDAQFGYYRNNRGGNTGPLNTTVVLTEAMSKARWVEIDFVSQNGADLYTGFNYVLLELAGSNFIQMGLSDSDDTGRNGVLVYTGKEILTDRNSTVKRTLRYDLPKNVNLTGLRLASGYPGQYPAPRGMRNFKFGR